MSNQEPPRPPAPPTQPTQPLSTPAPPTPPVATSVAPQPVIERLPPELPAEGPWWDNPWPAIVTGVLCLVVGGLLGYAIGNKREPANEANRGRRAAITQTVTHTTTVVHPKVIVHTNTVTAEKVTQTPAPANSANEQRRTEAETNLRQVERENAELRRQTEEN